MHGLLKQLVVTERAERVVQQTGHLSDLIENLLLTSPIGVLNRSGSSAGLRLASHRIEQRLQIVVILAQAVAFAHLAHQRSRRSWSGDGRGLGRCEGDRTGCGNTAGDAIE